MSVQDQARPTMRFGQPGMPRHPDRSATLAQWLAYYEEVCPGGEFNKTLATWHYEGCP